jgi:hypothetical protein
MKYEDLKDLKTGDKVVVRVGETNKVNRYWTVQLDGIGIDGWIENEAVIAVCNEPAKIKMTVEEKKEFDKLLKRHPGADLNDLLDAIYDYSKTYSALHKRLFGNTNGIVDRKKQFEFARALENPDLIEVVKPKKYYVHLISDKPRTYLGYERIFKTYFIGSKDKETHNIQRKFTKDEIKNFDLSFEIKPEALEEVEEDENDI